MGPHKELCFVSVGTLLFSILLLYESRKLEGYKFPVYSTAFCPRNETEWNERSSAINCNETNGYMCLPNEKLTELIEFCYIDPFAWVEEGTCLYLVKGSSRVDGYKCVHFISGCHNSSHMSSIGYEYQSCVSIGNGCFIAEPSCNSTTTSSLETTKSKNIGNDPNSTTLDTPINDKEVVTINIENNTTDNARKSTDQKKFGNESVDTNSNTDLITSAVAISLGILFPACVIGILSIYYKKGCVICNRNSDVECSAVGVGEHEPLCKEKEKYKWDSIKKELQKDPVYFDLWRQQDKLFFPTKSCKEVENLIMKQNLVIVVGHSGSGKSAIIQHIALKYRNQGWTVQRVNELMDVLKAVDSNNVQENQTLFVLNDPIGKESFDELKFTYWENNGDILDAYFEKIKILISCRTCVQRDKRTTGLFIENSNIVDIDSDTYKLSNDEKKEILNIYNSNNYTFPEIQLTEILKTETYFPLLCKLFFSNETNQEDAVRFFTKPVSKIEKDIREFRKSNLDGYCALILLVIFNNCLCVSDLTKDELSKEKFKHALELCGKSNTAPHTIGDVLEALKGFYVSKIGDYYEFCHDFVMEVTTYVFGSDHSVCMIRYADTGFLRRRVRFRSHDENGGPLTIYLSDGHIDRFGERLFSDIFGEHLLDVVLNPCLKNEKIVDVLIKKLESPSKKLKQLLEIKDLQLDKLKLIQEPEEAPKESLLFKLECVDLKDGISPLCALILFRHTRLSLHCLNVLNKSQSISKNISLFFAVCCNGEIDLFNMFLDDDIKKFLKEKLGRYHPIHIASMFHNLEILRIILGFEVDVNRKCLRGWTALTLAVSHNTEESMENNVKIPNNTRCDNTIRLLLSYNAGINICNNIGESPLSLACRHRKFSTVKLLLSHGADSNICNRNGVGPLYIACLASETSIVELLLRNGADINLLTKDGSSLLFTANQGGHDNVLKILLSHGAKVNLCNKSGRSPLHVSCMRGLNTTVQLLLENGANINLRSEEGFSPLLVACHDRHISTVELLIENGADINLCNEQGFSPLHNACYHGCESILQYLIRNGANINLLNKEGSSPIYVACNEGHISTVELLIKNGADINLCNEQGFSPLHNACYHGRESIVQYLISNGANINLLSEGGYSPFHFAFNEGHISTAKLLIENGALYQTRV